MLTSGPCSCSQALYENMLVELPFAGFFLSKLLGTSADVCGFFGGGYFFFFQN